MADLGYGSDAARQRRELVRELAIALGLELGS
jgi:hypothetical protein